MYVSVTNRAGTGVFVQIEADPTPGRRTRWPASTQVHQPTRNSTEAPKRKKVSTHWLYIAVIVAVVAGAAVGLIFGKDAAGLAIIGTAFVNLIKMMIGPIIFCTIVLGIGSVRKASQVGKVGGYRAAVLHRDVHLRAGPRPAGRQPDPPR